MSGSSTESLVEAVAHLCVEPLQLEQVFEGFCGLLSQAVPAPVVILMVRSGDKLCVEAYYRQDALVKPDSTWLPADSISGSVMHAMKSRMFLRDEDWPERTQQFTFGGEGVRPSSAIYVPLVTNGAAIGVLTVQSFVPDAYGERDVELLERCAPHLAARVRAEFDGRL